MKLFEIGTKKTSVFFMHGLRGHGLSQRAALQHITKNSDVSLTSVEMDGHGEESKTRHCLVPRYQKTVKDICANIQRQASESEQVILMGYSFGATLMILAAEALHNDLTFTPKVAGIVGVSTAFNVGHNVPKWQLGLSSAIGPISRFLFENSSRFSPFLTIHGMDANLISIDKTVVQTINEDPLIYKGRIPLATSAQVYRAGLAAKSSLRNSTISCLLLHSIDDGIALAPAKSDFSENVTLKLYKHLRHNCIDGVSREVVAARRAIIDFIVARL